MTKKPSTLPRGYRTCTASLAVADVPTALAFYKDAFGAATQTFDSEDAPTFAAIKIGTSMLFVTAGWGSHVPAAPGAAAPVGHHMYVEDVDATLSAALDHGASLISPVDETYWGERCATVIDPFGHIWTLATRTENLKLNDIRERRKELLNPVLDVEQSDIEHDEMDQHSVAA